MLTVDSSWVDGSRWDEWARDLTDDDLALEHLVPVGNFVYRSPDGESLADSSDAIEAIRRSQEAAVAREVARRGLAELLGPAIPVIDALRTVVSLRGEITFSLEEPSDASMAQWRAELKRLAATLPKRTRGYLLTHPEVWPPEERHVLIATAGGAPRAL